MDGCVERPMLPLFFHLRSAKGRSASAIRPSSCFFFKRFFRVKLGLRPVAVAKTWSKTTQKRLVLTL